MTRYSKYITPPQQGADLGPNEYTYVEGYGFTPQPPIVTERRLLQWYSNGIGFAILLYLILIRVVPFLVIWMTMPVHSEPVQRTKYPMTRPIKKALGAWIRLPWNRANSSADTSSAKLSPKRRMELRMMPRKMTSSTRGESSTT